MLMYVVNNRVVDKVFDYEFGKANHPKATNLVIQYSIKQFSISRLYDRRKSMEVQTTRGPMVSLVLPNLSYNDLPRVWGMISFEDLELIVDATIHLKDLASDMDRNKVIYNAVLSMVTIIRVKCPICLDSHCAHPPNLTEISDVRV